MSATDALAGWVPYRVRSGDAPPRVAWCHLGAERFTAPFFALTIDACLRKPFNQLFAHETAIDALVEAERLRPGLAPTAFIFHCSRCGSTLYAQLAAALPQSAVRVQVGGNSLGLMKKTWAARHSGNLASSLFNSSRLASEHGHFGWANMIRLCR